MTDIGELESFLYVRVTSTKKFVKLDLSMYTHKVLDKFADLIVRDTE